MCFDYVIPNLGAVLGDDGQIILTGPIELPPGRFERELYY